MATLKTYYHIAPVEAIETIKIEGVRCGADKHIYLLTTLEAELAPFDLTVRIADLLAVSQLGLAEYVLIEIDAKGITSQIKPDLVGESTAAQQKRIRQNLIKPEYITKLTRCKTNSKSVELYKNGVILLMLNPNIRNKMTRDITPMFKKLVNPS